MPTSQPLPNHHGLDPDIQSLLQVIKLVISHCDQSNFQLRVDKFNPNSTIKLFPSEDRNMWPQLVLAMTLAVLVSPLSGQNSTASLPPLGGYSRAPLNRPMKPPALGDAALDQLQAEIDALRLKLISLEEEFKSKYTPTEIEALHKKVEDINEKLEDLFKRLDQTSSATAQKLRKAVEEMLKRTDTLEEEMSSRIKTLEAYHDTAQSIHIREALLRKEVNYAGSLVEALIYPPLVIPRIIIEGYNNDFRQCDVIIQFIKLFSEAKLETKAQALELLLDEVIKNEHIYRNGEAGSDCILRIALQTRGTEQKLKSKNGHISAIIRKLPQPLRVIVFEGTFYMLPNGYKFRCFRYDDPYEDYVFHEQNKGKFGDTSVSAEFVDEGPDKNPNAEEPLDVIFRFVDKHWGIPWVRLAWDKGNQPLSGMDPTAADFTEKSKPFTLWKPVLTSEDTIIVQNVKWRGYPRGYLGERLLGNTIDCFEMKFTTGPSVTFHVVYSSD